MLKKLPMAFAVVALATPVIAAELGPQDIQRAVDTYKQNEIRFERDFKGRTIGFTWIFYKASSRLFSNGYRVSFGNNGDVVCTVQDPKVLDQIVEWNKGQKVSVSGTIDDVTFGTLYLQGCTIQALRKMSPAQGAVRSGGSVAALLHHHA